MRKIKLLVAQTDLDEHGNIKGLDSEMEVQDFDQDPKTVGYDPRIPNKQGPDFHQVEQTVRNLPERKPSWPKPKGQPSLRHLNGPREGIGNPAVATVTRPFLGKQSAWLIIRRGNSKYLLCRRSKANSNPGTWNWIGGSVDAGETPKLAAIREFKEEAGIDLANYFSRIQYISAVFNPVTGGTCHFFLLQKPPRLDLDSLVFNDENDKGVWINIYTMDVNPVRLHWPTLASLGILKAIERHIRQAFLKHTKTQHHKHSVQDKA